MLIPTPDVCFWGWGRPLQGAEAEAPAWLVSFWWEAAPRLQVLRDPPPLPPPRAPTACGWGVSLLSWGWSVSPASAPVCLLACPLVSVHVELGVVSVPSLGSCLPSRLSSLIHPVAVLLLVLICFIPLLNWFKVWTRSLLVAGSAEDMGALLSQALCFSVEFPANDSLYRETTVHSG